MRATQVSNRLVTRDSEAEGRPRGPGGLGPQYIEDIRRKKSCDVAALFVPRAGLTEVR